MDEAFAYFVEVQEGVNIYCSDTQPFIRFAQHANARRIIHVPLQEFTASSHIFNADLANTIYLPNHGRCGSTITAQVFEKNWDVYYD